MLLISLRTGCTGQIVSIVTLSLTCFCLLQVLPHRSLDTTAERHFGENLRDHMLEEIQIVEEDFSTKVKAIITDAASDCRKARQLVVAQHPHILSLDCFAHQVQSMAASYIAGSCSPYDIFLVGRLAELLLGNVVQCVLPQKA